MSFQGDVAGIGLAELLQSLSRGEREGVLLLDAPGRQARIGILDGLLFLLPAADEDPDVWSERCARAWPGDLTLALRERRAREIARAARLENLYALLDAPYLHFRFAPEALPAGAVPSAADATAEGGEPTFGPGQAVEHLLLEHARLHDESQGKAELAPCAMPLARDPRAQSGPRRALLESCDGHSTLREIADRLGSPLRQLRASVLEGLERGELSLLEPRACLAEAELELAQLRTGRAAERLAAWERADTPGPLPAEIRDFLIGEWCAGRLVPALRQMGTREARALLRRLDRSCDDASGALERWEAMRESNRSDTSTLLRCMAWRCANGGATAESALPELLRLASHFRERGQGLRAATALRLAARLSPAQLPARLELGAQFLELGLAEEGSAWLLSAARELINARELERALSSLRSLLKVDTENREAQGLLLEASSLAVRRRRRRVHVGAAGALLALGLLAAVVRVHALRELEDRLAAVSAMGGDPPRALLELEREFAGEDRPEVAALRAALRRRLAEQEQVLRQQWTLEYDAARRECEHGDPLAGFQTCMELRDPPVLQTEQPEWPTRAGLLSLLGKRLEQMGGALDPANDTSDDKWHAEERLIGLLREFEQRLELGVPGPEVADFAFHIQQIQKQILAQREQRAEVRQQQVEDAELEGQDRLLEAARMHALAGDLERALQNYAQLSAACAPDSLAPLQAEQALVQRHYDAVQQALALIAQGQHAEAKQVLLAVCPRPREHLFSWRFESDPPGARVRWPDGQARVTPFAMQSAFGEELSFELELAGYEPRTVNVGDPAHLHLRLGRLPECSWSTASRVEAAPVTCGEDHIVADRHGQVLRLSSRGEARWKASLPSLGGVARTPVFLPGRPGWLLVLCEDGLAFALDHFSGTWEGPFDLRSPPAEGPVALRSGVIAKLVDGRYAQWTDALEPHIFSSDPPYLAGDGRAAIEADLQRSEKVPGDMCILRRSARAESRLACGWSDWSVEVREDDYEVRRANGSEQHFCVRRNGTWNYLAWEAPNALIPGGRLWISDGAGLRSFLP